MKKWSKVIAGVAFWGLAAVSASAQEEQEKAPEGVKTKTKLEYHIFIDKESGVPKKEFAVRNVSKYDEKGNKIREEGYKLQGDAEILQYETDIQYEYYGKKK